MHGASRQSGSETQVNRVGLVWRGVRLGGLTLVPPVRGGRDEKSGIGPRGIGDVDCESFGPDRALPRSDVLDLDGRLGLEDGPARSTELSRLSSLIRDRVETGSRGRIVLRLERDGPASPSPFTSAVNRSPRGPIRSLSLLTRPYPVSRGGLVVTGLTLHARLSVTEHTGLVAMGFMIRDTDIYRTQRCV